MSFDLAFFLMNWTVISTDLAASVLPMTLADKEQLQCQVRSSVLVEDQITSRHPPPVPGVRSGRACCLPAVGGSRSGVVSLTARGGNQTLGYNAKTLDAG